MAHMSLGNTPHSMGGLHCQLWLAVTPASWPGRSTSRALGIRWESKLGIQVDGNPFKWVWNTLEGGLKIISIFNNMISDFSTHSFDDENMDFCSDRYTTLLSKPFYMESNKWWKIQCSNGPVGAFWGMPNKREIRAFY